MMWFTILDEILYGKTKASSIFFLKRQKNENFKVVGVTNKKLLVTDK